MAVQNTSNLLDGPEPEPRRTEGPELKQCALCGRTGTRLFDRNFTGHRCTTRAACHKRRYGT